VIDNLIQRNGDVMGALSDAQAVHEFVMQTNFSRELGDLAAYASRIDVARNSSVDLLSSANQTHEEVSWDSQNTALYLRMVI